MNITLTMQADTAPELVNALQSLAGILAPQEITGGQPVINVTAVTVPKEEKKVPKKVTPPAAETPAATTEAAAPAAEGETAVTLEQIRAAATAKRDAGKQDDIKKILEGLNVTRVVDLDKTQYATFLEKVNAL